MPNYQATMVVEHLSEPGDPSDVGPAIAVRNSSTGEIRFAVGPVPSGYVQVYPSLVGSVIRFYDAPASNPRSVLAVTPGPTIILQ